MKGRGNTYFLIVLTLVMVFIVIAAARLSAAESRLLPIMFGTAGAILCGIALFNEVRRKDAPPSPKPAPVCAEETAEATWSTMMLNMVWVGGFVVAIYFAGLLISIPLFMLVYTKWLGSRWLTSIITSAAMLLFIYLVFEKAVSISLYRGVLFGA